MAGYRPGKFVGGKQLTRNVEHLIKSIDDGDLEEALYQDAKVLQAAIKAAAPMGPAKKSSDSRKKLRNAIVAKKFAKPVTGKPAAFVAIDRNPKTGAPHAHLVEFGHEASGWYEGHERVPAHPFFRNTARKVKKLYNLESGLKRKFDKDLPT